MPTASHIHRHDKDILPVTRPRSLPRCRYNRLELTIIHYRQGVETAVVKARGCEVEVSLTIGIRRRLEDSADMAISTHSCSQTSRYFASHSYSRTTRFSQVLAPLIRRATPLARSCFGNLCLHGSKSMQTKKRLWYESVVLVYKELLCAQTSAVEPYCGHFHVASWWLPRYAGKAVQTI